MRALTTIPGRKDTIELGEVAEPAADDRTILAGTLAIGVCGTDHDIVAGEYGWAPPGHERLVLGHESLARVLEAPTGSGFDRGDLVVGIVRRPDPVPCAPCANGEWDMCANGRYTERGIKELDGYGAERVRIEPGFCVKLDPRLARAGVLLEPTSVVAKAWDEIERLGKRLASWQPRVVLVTGAGPIGLLAALLGAQRGLDVHVYDHVESGPKPELAFGLGATYHAPDLNALGKLAPDIVLECTGAAPVMVDAIDRLAPNGIACLAGVSSGGHKVSVDLGLLNREIVLENNIVFGSVNANRRHYELAADALARADAAWLERMISRRVPLERWREAFERAPEDVKVAIEFAT